MDRHELNSTKEFPACRISSARPTGSCPMPQLIIRKKSSNYRVIPFTDNLTIGRESDNDLVLDCPEISRHHARIKRRAGDFFLTDCGSTNGIWQGDRKIAHSRISNGFTFRIFEYFFTVVTDDPPSLVLVDGQRQRSAEKTIIFGIESFLPEAEQENRADSRLNPLQVDLPGDMHHLERIDTEPELLDRLLLCAVRSGNCDSGFIATHDRKGELIYRATHNLPPTGTGFSADRNLIDLAMNGKTVVCNHLPEDRIHVLCAPLKVGKKTEGCLYLTRRRDREEPSEETQTTIAILSLYGSLLLERIRSRIQAHRKQQNLRDSLEAKNRTIIRSKPMLRLYEDIKTIAPINVPILILGEPGTGKELVASALHEFSNRQGGYITLNCSAIPEGIFESELFGSVKGAFHGAGNKPGKLELAHNGTLFLDEIGDMEIVLQPKLLRFLENNEITRLGDTRVKTLDVRVIAATNQNLEEKIQQCTFRDDLFQRLSCFILRVPALRERREDIEPLIRYFLHRFADEYNWQPPSINKTALRELESFPWPGNIRELKNTVLRLSVEARGRTITMDTLMHVNTNFTKKSGQKVSPAPSLEEMERSYLRKTLESTGWNISEAAKIAGIARSTFYQKMKKYQLTMPAE
ncbi:MAG TPA: FHA domain-containing protein [Desulfobulbus sp.]|nr:FHA domain-containing protein [Desulfobulbus sp.]